MGLPRVPAGIGLDAVILHLGGGGSDSISGDVIGSSIYGWSWIHCIPELLCQGVLSLATTTPLDCPWMVVDTLYS